MKRLWWTVAVLFLTLGATPPQPPAAVTALTQAVLDAANTNDPAKLAAIYTADAVVIDEDTPFVWKGANAGAEWWHSVRKSLALRHATLQATGLAFTEYRQDPEGDRAYVIQPLKITIHSGGKTITEYGAQTYTLREESGVWKISSATWTTR